MLLLNMRQVAARRLAAPTRPARAGAQRQGRPIAPRSLGGCPTTTPTTWSQSRPRVLVGLPTRALLVVGRTRVVCGMPGPSRGAGQHRLALPSLCSSFWAGGGVLLWDSLRRIYVLTGFERPISRTLAKDSRPIGQARAQAGQARLERQSVRACKKALMQ